MSTEREAFLWQVSAKAPLLSQGGRLIGHTCSRKHHRYQFKVGSLQPSTLPM